MDQGTENRNLVQNVSRNGKRKALQGLQPCSKDEMTLVGTNTPQITRAFVNEGNRNQVFTMFKVLVDDEVKNHPKAISKKFYK